MPSATNGASLVGDEDASTHKRTPSGGLFSKIPFLRSSPASAQKANGTPDSPTIAFPPLANSTYAAQNGERRASAPSTLMLKSKSRSRKGSLRKTALLGTGTKLRLDQLETIVSPRLDTTEPPGQPPAFGRLSSDADADDDLTPRGSLEDENGVYGNKNAKRNNKSTSSEEGLTLRRSRTPRSGRSDVSTTDEEEGETKTNGSASLKQLKEDPASYFTLNPGGLLRRYSSRKQPTAKSPLSSLPMETSPTPDDWDYAETEWWGWIILIVTWVVFVIGMGSCFGVWSWAWDVGETPYAPPELEDDATLPIVGYYPALIILTGVMAWVWVITAWVGMKYFKHAKISGEDV